MKKVLYVMTISLMVLVGCKGVKTLSTGLENESYLLFIGKPGNYSNGLDVNIDGKTMFKAKVNKDQFKPSRDRIYGITTGSHAITVLYNDKIIFKEQIFVSTQETRKIVLP
jgi:bacillopeptidase F (M6 metalloprotease family)